MRNIKKNFFFICTFFSLVTQAQDLLHGNVWKFRKAGSSVWYPATVPGTVYTDLLKNKLIPEPYFSDNEKKTHWVDSVDWEYKITFTIPTTLLQKDLELIFEGLDTYSGIYINNKKLIETNNMFHPWQMNIRSYVKPGINELKVYFHSALRINQNLAEAALPLVLPDNNRVYSRKAQFQFGWDWGPTMINAGIYKPVSLTIKKTKFITSSVAPVARLVQEKDAIGSSFYFTKNDKPVYIKGANWIPADALITQIHAKDYRALLMMAKEAGMNMLRVWGGGIYEPDIFYQLCDSLNIMIWQDFMFAGGMYPGDEDFFKQVKEEVQYQVKRLSKYKSVVLWCGNNEIDEAWHHWGWQNSYNLHGKDSALVWNNYTRLFKDSLPAWVKAYDGLRSYISTSPMYGWGNPKSYTHGDSHYWGLWWGLADWESWETHTGRFVSEYGMQAMPHFKTIKAYTEPTNRIYQSDAIQSHQKANEGFKKLNYYIDKYFYDTSRLSALSLEEYGYITQCLQYYILKNSIAIQMKKQPCNMGTLVWQLNDCWPATSWSLIDYYKRPKAGYYAVKNAYLQMDTTKDNVYPKNLKLQKPSISIGPLEKDKFILLSNTDAKYVEIYCTEAAIKLSDNYFDLKANVPKIITIQPAGKKKFEQLKIRTLYSILQKQ
ncbi:MAG: glycoside hydrolase family 2 protein [Niastella sp.]|nr:glycoside hydrolase family 2 protein [Niastella sp.]